MVNRFHLVQNVRQALEAFLLDHRSTLQAAAVYTAMALTQADSPIPVASMYRGRRQSPKPAEPREDPARPPRHVRWVAIDAAVHTLRAQGTPLATIARRLGISRPPVYAYLRCDTPPVPRRFPWRPSARVLTPYLPDLIRRWRATQADSVQLWREIQALGYTHSALTSDRLPLHHPTAACWRDRRVSSAGVLAVHPSAGSLRPCGVARHGVPGRQAVA